MKCNCFYMEKITNEPTTLADECASHRALSTQQMAVAGCNETCGQTDNSMVLLVIGVLIGDHAKVT